MKHFGNTTTKNNSLTLAGRNSGDVPYSIIETLDGSFSTIPQIILKLISVHTCDIYYVIMLIWCLLG